MRSDFVNKKHLLTKIITQFGSQFEKKNFYLKQIQQMYSFCKKKVEIHNNTTVKTASSKKFKLYFWKEKLKLQQLFFWVNCLKQLRKDQNQSFFLSPRNKRIFIFNKKILLNWNTALLSRRQILWLNKNFI